MLRLAFLVAFLCLGFLNCHTNPYKQGEILYKYHCGPCHMDDGSGLAKLIPPLDSSRLTLGNPGKLVCLIRKGRPKNQQTGQQMIPNTSLNDVEMTNLINFLGSKYAANAQTVDVEEVKKMLGNCQSQ
jgi:mono/diheme cytochrome c family protein